MLTHDLQRSEIMKKRRDVEVECVEETIRVRVPNSFLERSYFLKIIKVWRVVG